MKTQKPVLVTVAALAALAVTGAASTARADQLPYSNSNSFGSGNVSASYDVGADLVYCSAAELAEKTKVCQSILGIKFCYYTSENPECLVNASEQYAKASAYGTASLTVFGTTESIYVSPSATTSDGSSSLNFYATAFGTTLINSSATSIPIGFSPSFGASKDFSIVGIKVKVEAEASAFIGGTLSGGAISNGFALTVTPTISAGLDASASVSVLCASAGIEGNVDLLDLELPSTLSVAYSSGTLKYGLNSAFQYTLLDGSLKVRACLCGACDGTTIASYSGYSGNFSLVNVSSSLSL